jgi:hypothetical protein
MIVRTMAAGIAAFVVAAVLMSHQPAHAFIALAVGATGDPNDGIAIGTGYNHKTPAQARDRALRECRTFKTAPKANRHCQLIGVLANGCLAAAFDPKSDSTGMGWSIAETRAGAEDQAMALCKTAAPGGRAQYCKLDLSRCEGD